jgi:hypothetical protein
VPKSEPTIKRVLDTDEFELPIGIEINGEFHKTVKLKEMTGKVEEAIADSKVRNNGGKVITEAINGVIEQLGSLKKHNKNMVRNMYSVDRDYLLLMNHLVSIDDHVKYDDICPSCGGKSEINVNIEDIPVSYLQEDEPKVISLELPRGVKDAEGNVYKKIKVSFPTGVVQERIFNLLQQNPNQAITQMLAFICEDIEGLSHWNPDTFANMTKRDRKFISEELGKVEVGADLTPEVSCANCGHEYKSVIPVRTLLGE